MEYYMPEPPKNNSNGFSIIIFLAIIAFLLYSLEACLSNPKHYCNWVDCEYQGEVISKDNFTSKWGYIPESDGYVVELTHFMNPKWTYEQCEEYVFKTNSK